MTQGGSHRAWMLNRRGAYAVEASEPVRRRGRLMRLVCRVYPGQETGPDRWVEASKVFDTWEQACAKDKELRAKFRLHLPRKRRGPGKQLGLFD